MRRRWRYILTGILAAVMMGSMLCGLFIPQVSAATSSSEIKKQINALKEQKSELDSQIKALESQLSDNKSEIQAIVDRKNIIDQEVSLLNEQISNINEQIASYNVLIADKQTELEAAEAHLADLNAKYKDRIRAMEEGGILSYWSVLFKANSFSDLLDRLSMIEEIAAADNRRLKEIRAAAAVVTEAKKELQTQKEEIEVTKEELNASQVVLDEKRGEADKLLTELIAKGDEYLLLLEEAEDKDAELMLQIAQKEKDYKNARYREWLATSVPPTTKKPTSSSVTGSVGTSGSAGTPRSVNGITWLVPVNYVKFTSPYGWRTHPVYGTQKFHYGVDLAAPCNTPIIATRSGTVTIASYNSSSGYYVTVNHGDGFSSVYMHMTKYIVSEGQIVSAGQVIGYVGSTGVSTGYHLHFGIMKNGTYVNPAEYIKI